MDDVEIPVLLDTDDAMWLLVTLREQRASGDYFPERFNDLITKLEQELGE